jgi:hypothetical protein
MGNKKPTITPDVEAEMAEALDAPETALATVDQMPSALATVGGIPIEGLQDIPVTRLPVPFVKMVQPSSTEVQMEDGKDALPGTFFFTDLQKSYSELSFVMLRAKEVVTDFERDGKITPTPQLKILGITLDTQKLFILNLSITSFQSFFKLIAKLKENKVQASWAYEIKASTQKTENKKGKYFVVQFQLVRKITGEEFEALSETYGAYGGALDRQALEEDETVE